MFAVKIYTYRGYKVKEIFIFFKGKLQSGKIRNLKITEIHQNLLKKPEIRTKKIKNFADFVKIVKNSFA